MATWRLFLFAAALALSACALGRQDAPSPAGPSGYALSLDATASPDRLAQNGASQSVITVLARNAASQPVAGLSIRAELFVDGVRQDFGTLSSRSASTGSDGRAVFGYFAPPPDPPATESDHLVTIGLTPAGRDAATATERCVAIKLIRPGIVLPPNRTPTPDFFFSPLQPHENETVLFDGSMSSDDGTIVSYGWSFGDGSGGTGIRSSHKYMVAGTYNVILTVKDDRGLSVSTSPKPVTVQAAANPVASFTISPTDPTVNDVVRLNAAGSTMPAGRSIVSYEWDFGDSLTATGIMAEHRYQATRTYTIVLTVTDSAGLKNTTSKSIQVKQGSAAALR